MLQELHIRNFALIEALDLRLEGGLTVLTGETGAGKSIIIDAVNLLLGGRATGDWVRTGCEEALVEGVFSLEPGSRPAAFLREQGLEERQGDEVLLILTRELTRTGRHRCRINGRTVTLQVVEELGRYLLDLHGQHEHQSLLHVSRQLELLDAFGGAETEQGRRQVEELFTAWRSLRAELAALEEDEAERSRREEMLRYQWEEIERANLQPGEDEALERERAVLRHAERLFADAQAAYRLLYEGEEGGRAVLDQLAEAQEALERILSLDPTLGEASQLLQAARCEVEEAARSVAAYRDRIEADPDRLAQIEERLDLLSRLKRKYGPALEDVLAYRQKVQDELEALARRDERRGEVQGKLQTVEEELIRAAEALSVARQKAGQRLAEQVVQALAEVNMPRSVFVVSSQWLEAAGSEASVQVNGRRWQIWSHGLDRLEFLLSANPGEEPRPLAKIASGGELSRVMLVLKTLLAEQDDIPTLIFDEVDAGISGRTAQAVAEKLALLARTRQVICVTHLPQIASMADQHIFVEKVVEGRETRVTARSLRREERVQELARLLGGAKVTEVTRSHAEEMMSLAEQVKSHIQRK